MQAPKNTKRSVAVLLIAIALTIVGVGALAVSHHPAASATGNTLVGKQGNANPEGPGVTNWIQLKAAFENNVPYQGCEKSRLNVTWAQVKAYAKLVKEGHQLNAILISNSDMTVPEAVSALEAQGYTNVAGLPVITDGLGEGTALMNTANDPSVAPTNSCYAFPDGRAQVRLVLTIPISVPPVKALPKGIVPASDILTNEFNLGECANQADIYKLVAGAPAPAPTVAPAVPYHPVVPMSPPTHTSTPPTTTVTPTTVAPITTTPPTTPTPVTTPPQPPSQTPPTTGGCPDNCTSVYIPPAKTTTATTVPGSSTEPADPVVGPPAVAGVEPTQSTGGLASGSTANGSAPTGTACVSGGACTGGASGGGTGPVSTAQSGQSNGVTPIGTSSGGGTITLPTSMS